MERLNYHGWPHSCRLHNDTVEVVLLADVGPRIIRFGFLGQENEFKEYPELAGQTGGDQWNIYGGHRLWHAPESHSRTYLPDNGPVEVEEHRGFVRLIQPAELSTGIQKEMDVHLAPQGARVQVTHRLRNQGLWPVYLAPWALSVMAPGGCAIAPLPPYGAHGAHLLPTRSLALWPYTDMQDPRWFWGTRYLRLRQDPEAATAQKAGLNTPGGWVAYARNSHLFVKKFHYIPEGVYPDLGSSVELFTNADMLEVETLGPLVELTPGSQVDHVERWSLFEGVRLPDSDEEVEAEVLPRVREDWRVFQVASSADKVLPRGRED